MSSARGQTWDVSADAVASCRAKVLARMLLEDRRLLTYNDIGCKGPSPTSVMARDSH